MSNGSGKSGGKSNGSGAGGVYVWLGVAIVGMLWFAWASLGSVDWRTVGAGGEVDGLWMVRYQPWLIALVLAEGLAAFGGMGLLLWKRTSEELETRLDGEYAVLPSVECNPGGVKVDRFARSLAGAPQPVTHWLFWRATSFRFAMVSAGNGKVLQTVTVAGRNASGLLAAYEQIDGAELIPRDQLDIAEPAWADALPASHGSEQVDE